MKISMKMQSYFERKCDMRKTDTILESVHKIGKNPETSTGFHSANMMLAENH